MASVDQASKLTDVVLTRFFRLGLEEATAVPSCDTGSTCTGVGSLLGSSELEADDVAWSPLPLNPASPLSPLSVWSETFTLCRRRPMCPEV